MLLDLAGVLILDSEHCNKVRDLNKLTEHLNKLISRVPLDNCTVKINDNTAKNTLTLLVISKKVTVSKYDGFQLLNIFGLLVSYGFKFIHIDDKTLKTCVVANPVDFVGRKLKLF